MGSLWRACLSQGLSTSLSPKTQPAGQLCTPGLLDALCKVFSRALLWVLFEPFFLYSDRRYNVTESLATVLLNDWSFKCSLGMPENK